MATIISTKYIGDEQCLVSHGPTGATIKTDLPPDNGGKGRTFSPTDLFASSLGSCILTIMAKMATRDGMDFQGAEINVEKIMTDNPRRVGKFILEICFPSTLNDAQRRKLLLCVASCPVHKSLHPDIKIEIIQK